MEDYKMAIFDVMTWSASTNDYNQQNNWDLSQVPSNSFDEAVFGLSTITSVSINGIGFFVGEWVFKPGVPPYSFTLTSTQVSFTGGGIIANGVSVTITVISGAGLAFYNTSTAGNASIFDNGSVQFSGMSTGGTADIKNNSLLSFFEYSSAGSATIHTLAGKFTYFYDFTTGGNALLITDASGTVDFSGSSGPAGDHKLTVGSINGGGTYKLGADQLTVLSGAVSGLIEDNGLGGSLVKAGHDALTLSFAGNTYSGGTAVEGGTLGLAALGAAGTGDITFKDGAKHNIETLIIENAALSGHVFTTNNIDLFGKHTVLDLSGLKFHKGATAKYHPATHILDVHSGGVTDVFKLLSPAGTHFKAASDGHGGTKVTLNPPHHTVASLSTHDVAEVHWATDTAGSAGHLSDFLFTA
jgi:autotransporter-associated beta strand protein